VRVLIVDDDPGSRLILQKTLARLGHEPIPAEGGVQALARFQMEHFPVVITDWKMPEVDGLELCRRIRADLRPRYTYIIVLTALEGKASYLEGMRAGADDYLVKPLDVPELEARLFVAERVLKLQSDLRTLEGLLPICSYCKRIRDGDVYWRQVESFIQSRTEAQFSHSICPDCYQSRVAPQIEEMRKQVPPPVPPR
jgi:DNA-binding response OmpR family regulator